LFYQKNDSFQLYSHCMLPGKNVKVSLSVPPEVSILTGSFNG